MNMPSRRRVAVVIVLSLLVTASVALFFKGNRLILTGWLSFEPSASGRPLRYWLYRLQRNDSGSWDAENYLVQIGPAAVPPLNEILLQAPTPGVSQTWSGTGATRCLCRLGESGHAALISHVRSGLPFQAHLALVHAIVDVIGQKHSPPLAVLIEASKFDDQHLKDYFFPWNVRNTDAGGVLTSLGDLHRKAVTDALGQALRQHEDIEVRRRAASLLYFLRRPDRPEVVELLLEGLKDEDRLTRVYAATSLWQIERWQMELPFNRQKTSPKYLPVLTEAVSSDDPKGREEALKIFLAVHPFQKDPPAREYSGVIPYFSAGEVAPLVAALADAADRDKGARQMIAEALGRIGPDARSAVPALVGILRAEELKLPHSYPRARDEAATALGRIGPGAREAVPDLIDTLQLPLGTKTHAETYLRNRCAEALGWIGDERAIGPLIGSLSGSMRFEISDITVTEALKRIARKSKAVVPALILGLEHKDADVRSSCAALLRERVQFGGQITTAGHESLRQYEARVLAEKKRLEEMKDGKEPPK